LGSHAGFGFAFLKAGSAASEFPLRGASWVLEGAMVGFDVFDIIVDV